MKKGIRLLLKILFFIASYSPLFIMVSISKLEEISYKVLLDYLFSLWWIILLIIVSIMISILWIKSAREFHRISIDSENLEKQNYELLNYLVTYLIPLLTLDLTSMGTIVANALLFFIILIFYLRDDNLHMSLILFFLGYNIFTDGKYFYLSKEKYSTLVSEQYELEYASISGSIYRILKKR